MTLREAIMKAFFELGIDPESLKRAMQRADWIVPEGKKGSEAQIPIGEEREIIDHLKRDLLKSLNTPGIKKVAKETLEKLSSRN